MTLHEIIHNYLRLTPQEGKQWLQELVVDAGLESVLVKHIEALPREEKNEGDGSAHIHAPSDAHGHGDRIRPGQKHQHIGVHIERVFP